MLVKKRDAKIPKQESSAYSSGVPGTDVGPYGENFVEDVTGMEFVWLPGGGFTMGDLLGDHKDDGWLEFSLPVHRVQLKGFYLGRYAVTQKEWTKIMWINPSRFQTSGYHPVESVSWEDVQNFIRKLNFKSKKNFTLPSEAQWEYAAREGKNSRFGTGRDTIGPEEANFDAHEEYKTIWSRGGVYRGETVAVDSFSPNSFGLYQMSGNVWEWCQDIWHSDYSGAPADGSAWESGGGDPTHRVVRGGSWYNYPFKLHAANRLSYKSSIRFDNLGCRLALNVG